MLLQFHFIIYYDIFLILLNFLYLFIPILSSTLFYLSSQVRIFCTLEIRCVFFFCYYFLLFVAFYTLYFCHFLQFFLYLSYTKCYFISPLERKLATFWYCPHFLSYIHICICVCMYIYLIYIPHFFIPHFLKIKNFFFE
jgi:hypothetical protein